MTDLRPGLRLLDFEMLAKRFCREHPRAAALSAFAVLMGWLAVVYAACPGELRFAGDLERATIRVDGVEVKGPVAKVWPAGRCVIEVKRPGFADVRLVADVSPLSRATVTVPGTTLPAPAPPAVEKPRAPITEEEIAAEVERLESASEAELLAAVPASQRDATIARDAATRAFARCRAAGKWDRSVLVFAPACAWCQRQPGAFAADPWDAAAAAADLAPEDGAARALLCAARLALALGRPVEARDLFVRVESTARRRALEGNVDEALAVTREALAASPPDGPREKLGELLEMCRRAGR